ncbi:hypothetical protein QW060_25490 [Myroides ceti]|uniref:Uncharacterized protein n=1 Tax=Paenimyroides ceti TaxID=395087 RepID=A0ABT8D051_9FLAO|nr:hypothetical protein [Paenimyroides ceti]MDN3710223.1 hypothetical protein [Paenimyroides ceti]
MEAGKVQHNQSNHDTLWLNRCLTVNVFRWQSMLPNVFPAFFIAKNPTI